METRDIRWVGKSCWVEKDGKPCPGDFEFPMHFGEEDWRDIDGWEGYYQVSNLGRVRGLDRWNDKHYIPGKVLTGSKMSGKNRYLAVKLSRDNRVVETPSIHRLVYRSWVGEIPEDMTIDHINGNPLDNRACNLRTLTVEENINAYYRKRGKSRGIHFCNSRGKWQVRCGIGGKEKYLGAYLTKEEAQKVYNEYYISKRGKLW